MRTKSHPAATSRTWKPSVGGARQHHRHAVEDAGPGGGLDDPQLGIAEPRLAAVAAEQHVEADTA